MNPRRVCRFVTHSPRPASSPMRRSCSWTVRSLERLPDRAINRGRAPTRSVMNGAKAAQDVEPSRTSRRRTPSATVRTDVSRSKSPTRSPAISPRRRPASRHRTRIARSRACSRVRAVAASMIVMSCALSSLMAMSDRRRNRMNVKGHECASDATARGCVRRGRAGTCWRYQEIDRCVTTASATSSR